MHFQTFIFTFIQFFVNSFYFCWPGDNLIDQVVLASVQSNFVWLVKWQSLGYLNPTKFEFESGSIEFLYLCLLLTSSNFFQLLPSLAPIPKLFNIPSRHFIFSCIANSSSEFNPVRIMKMKHVQLWPISHFTKLIKLYVGYNANFLLNQNVTAFRNNETLIHFPSEPKYITVWEYDVQLN